jgi:two-component system NtrC family sensor kinase
MLRRMTSIRGKITAGYAMSFLFMVFVASVLFVNLLALEDWIGSYSGVSRFFDAALEMRRYEKNFLLYGKREDLDAALRYADAASAMVASGAVCGCAGAPWYRRWLRLIAVGAGDGGGADMSPERVGRLLSEYRAALEKAMHGPGAGAGAPGAAVRDRGRGITEIAERLSALESGHLQGMLRSGRRALIVLVALFLLGTGMIARVVLRHAILPLKDLEAGMQRIASGEFQMLPLGSGNAEIESMHTAFNRMIREILQHRQEALQSERLASLGTMLAGIAHEINNPLSNISTSAEILREENETASPAERSELIEQILSQTDRATSIMRTVLDYSRETRFERRSTNLLSAVRGSAILVRGGSPEHVAVDIDVPPDIEVLADKTKLEQAFINLMANSIDAMRDIGCDRRIAITARHAGDQTVEVAFADTGAGIPEELLDRIFDPFFSTKDVGRGTGLGLYVTHQIVEQHGGSIRVESQVGRGTTVTVRLPMAKPLLAAGGAQPQSQKVGS